MGARELQEPKYQSTYFRLQNRALSSSNNMDISSIVVKSLQLNHNTSCISFVCMFACRTRYVALFGLGLMS